MSNTETFYRLMCKTGQNLILTENAFAGLYKRLKSIKNTTSTESKIYLEQLYLNWKQ